MIVYRVCHAKFSDQLASSGRANRWNQRSQEVIYTSSTISLCALELLAHTSGIRPSGIFKVLHIKIADTTEVQTIHQDQLPSDWSSLKAYSTTQRLGSKWYENMNSLVLSVPSAIIPQESNYIINTRHESFSKNVHLIETTDFIWDHRFPEL
ncbi:RES family NAD+ phosphorylase [Reichenbachiella sp.]|uniref:RES family NAD+ phosphorylase n=1 Tax=Reichenbachiella sp. TaxID=2184521 RepID=UPI003B5B2319